MNKPADDQVLSISMRPEPLITLTPDNAPTPLPSEGHWMVVWENSLETGAVLIPVGYQTAVIRAETLRAELGARAWVVWMDGYGLQGDGHAQ